MADNQRNKIERLRVVMNRKKVRQNKMADLIGINPASLSKILSGKENRILPYGTSYILEVELGINRYWFDDGIGKMIKASATEQNDEDRFFERISTLERLIQEQERALTDLRNDKADLLETVADLRSDKKRLLQTIDEQAKKISAAMSNPGKGKPSRLKREVAGQ